MASISSARDRRLGDDGIWCERPHPAGVGEPAGRPALFLDRDGVLVEEVGYLHRPEDLRLLPGAAAVVAAANRRRIPVVVVTNQAGIGRGIYGWADFAATQAKLLGELGALGVALDLVLACPFHAEGRPPYRHPDHPCRKPRPGLLLRAAEVLGVDLGRSWIVGDRAHDILAGQAAGLAGGLHVLSGHGAADRAAVIGLERAGFTLCFGCGVADAAALPLLT